MQYATAKIGAILVNINPAYRTHELGYAVNQSGVLLAEGLLGEELGNSQNERQHPDC